MIKLLSVLSFILFSAVAVAAEFKEMDDNAAMGQLFEGCQVKVNSTVTLGEMNATSLSGYTWLPSSEGYNEIFADLISVTDTDIAVAAGDVFPVYKILRTVSQKEGFRVIDSKEFPRKIMTCDVPDGCTSFDVYLSTPDNKLLLLQIFLVIHTNRDPFPLTHVTVRQAAYGKIKSGWPIELQCPI
jgi:hypothetical protein